MARNRYVIHLTYADGTPGMAFHPTRAAALTAAQAPTHGGRRVAVAEVCERLSSGAECSFRTFRIDALLRRDAEQLARSLGADPTNPADCWRRFRAAIIDRHYQAEQDREPTDSLVHEEIR